MHWTGQFIGSSVGKKLLMALTGTCFLAFLIVHLAGNLTLYGGKEMFNSYAEHLHGLGPFLTIAEWGLLFLALVHVTTGLWLFFQNRMARPDRYVVDKRAGGRTYSSATMPYTGILILVFVVFHLLNFHFVDKSSTTIYEIVDNAFESLAYVILYVAAMVILALHVRHGFWSLFQTLGANHPKYMPIVMGASFVVSVVFGFGFGYLPIYLTISG